MTLIYLLIGVLPSFLQRPLRNLLGARIERGAKISPFTLIAVRDLHMGKGARIGSFVVAEARTFIMGRNARIRPLSKFRVRHFEMGRDAVIDPCVLVNCDFGPRSRLELGRAARVFSFSVLEPSEGIFIGDQTGLGGQCLIFCHGSWPNYLEGAPYSRGPVRLGEEVWIPWRVMILPNVEIGSGAVIGAHSLVRSNVPARSLYSGVPARLVVENVWSTIDDVGEKESRLMQAVETFHAFHEEQFRGRVEVLPLSAASTSFQPSSQETVFYSFDEVGRPEVARAVAAPGGSVVDLRALRCVVAGPMGQRFVDHLATYGVRLSPTEIDEF